MRFGEDKGKVLNRRGKVVVIVAPSGTGKSTLLEKVKNEIPSLKWSVSCTTRLPRTGEVDGKDYSFMSEEEFVARKDRGEFLEWAKVHSNYYGTLKSFVDNGLDRGDFLLFDLDVQGCDQVKSIYGDEAKVIFIEPPSVEELETRLLKRATDSEEVIFERLNNAKKELERKGDFDYNIINDDFEKALTGLKEVINSIISE